MPRKKQKGSKCPHPPPWFSMEHSTLCTSELSVAALPEYVDPFRLDLARALLSLLFLASSSARCGKLTLNSSFRRLASRL